MTDTHAPPAVHFRGRIGITLIIAFMVLAIAPVAVLTTVILQQATNRVIETTILQEEARVERVEQELRHLIEDSQTILGLMIATEDQEQRMADILASERSLMTAVMLQTQFLDDQLVAQETFTELFLFNRTGRVRVSTDPNRLDLYITDEPYVNAFLESESIYVQPPYPEANYSGLMQIFIFLPVADDDGRVVGAFGGRLNMELLNELMENQAAGSENRDMLLITTDSRTVTPSLSSSYPSGSTVANDAISRALTGETFAGAVTSYREIDVIGAYRWIPMLQSVIVSEIPVDDALITINTARRQTLRLAGVLVIVAVGLGVLVTVWITRPITALRRVAAAVIREDYSQRAPVNRRNEIGELAHTFNQMTDKLVHTIDDLDQRVQELRVANARANEAVRLKDEFLAVMSHELRTPLNASIGFLGLLKMGGRLEDSDLRMVARARANNERLLELINNILDLSRIEAGRMNLVHEPFDLHQLINKIAEDTQVLAEQKQLTLEIKIESTVPQAFTSDVDALRKIVTNLLSNAIKFTDQGSVRLRVNRELDDLVIRISDTGVGIPDDKIETIFESFRQVDASSRRVHGGSGLGLSIVRNLARSLGGSVTVHSIIGKGSTFTVRLPFETNKTENTETSTVVET